MEQPTGEATPIESPNPQRYNLRAACTILGFTLFHIVLVMRFPLAADETYYWEWSRHLDWGYYDQGPMIGWVIRAGCLLFGDTQFGVRFPIIIAALLTQILVYLLARDLFGPRIAFTALLLSSITPLAMAGSFIATYDPLLVVFWAASAYFASRAILFGSHRAWYMLGITFGLGLLSKHTMALLVPSLFLFVVIRKEHRVWLSRKEPYIAMLIGMVLWLPNLWWVAKHDWITFKHVGNLAVGAAKYSPLRGFGEFLGSQVGLVTPLLALAFFYWMWQTIRRIRECDDRTVFIICLGPPCLLFFLLLSLNTKVQANWAACAWLTPAIGYAAWVGAAGNRSRRFRFGVGASIIAAMFSTSITFPEIRTALGLRTPSKWDQTNKAYGGAELGAAAQRIRKEMEIETGGSIAVCSATYDFTSRLAFYLPDKPRTYCLFLGTRLNSYWIWDGDWPDLHSPNVVLADGRDPLDPKRIRFEDYFDRVEAVTEPVIVRRPAIYTNPIATYYLYRCYGFHPGGKRADR